MRVAPDDEEVEFFVLAGGGFGEFGPAVAGIHAEEAGESVEVTVALVIPDIGALAPRDDRDLVLVVVTAHAGEMHPKVLAGLVLEIHPGCCTT